MSPPRFLMAGARRSAITAAASRPRARPPEKDPTTPRQAGYRIPRFIADLGAAIPPGLQIIEGIETIAGVELPRPGSTVAISPGVLVAGTNPVTTDAVAMAVMGFDPMAERGTSAV